MTEEKKKLTKQRGRPKKAPMKPLVERPTAFEENEELQLTEMQNAFVWHYVNDSCTQTEAARRAGFEFPAHAATRLMNARKNPNVTKAIMLQKAELAHKFAITPEKTAKMLWQISEEAYKKGQFNASVSAIRELNELAEGSLFLPTEPKIGKKSRFDGKSVTYAFFFREIPHSAQV
jgi:hypothetical protein